MLFFKLVLINNRDQSWNSDKANLQVEHWMGKQVHILSWGGGEHVGD